MVFSAGKEAWVMDAATEHDWVKVGLLIEGLQDWISLSNVHSSFLPETGAPRPLHEVQQLTLNMIRELVSEGLFELGSAAGTNRNPRLAPWDLLLDAAMAKIEDAYVTHFDDPMELGHHVLAEPHRQRRKTGP
jgi:hypothetical protein